MADDTKKDDAQGKKPAADKPAAKKAPAKAKPAAKKTESAAKKPAAKAKPAAAKATSAKAKAEPKAKAKAKDAEAKPAKSAAKPAATAAETPEERAAKQKQEAIAARRSGAVETRAVRAVGKYLRFSAQKGRLVVDGIRGQGVSQADITLAFHERAAAREIRKVLRSAVANAQNNHGMTADELYVEQAFVDEGPTLKRWKARARGRADRINKRTCHVTVVVNVATAEKLETRSARKTAGATGTARKPAGDRSKRVAASRSAQTKKKAPAKASGAGSGTTKQEADA